MEGIEVICNPYTALATGWVAMRFQLLYHSDFSPKAKKEGTFANCLNKELSRIYNSDRLRDWLKDEFTSIPLFRAVYCRLRPTKNSQLELESR